jgi:hypothetical protein
VTVDHVGPLLVDEIPQVAELYQKVFGVGRDLPLDGLTSYLRGIFFENPWYDEAMPSLVRRNARGRILGCLGILPRRMTLNGRPLRVAVTHTFMVDPDQRPGLAALELMRRFSAGVQDLALAQGNSSSRKLWQGLNGPTSLLYSLSWTRLLKPTRYILSLLGGRELPGPLRYALAPGSGLMDALLARLPRGRFHQPPPGSSGEELDPATFMAGLPEVVRPRALRPEYDDESVSWLFGILARRRDAGAFHKIAVRGVGRELLGWYLIYLASGRAGEVVQIGARPDTIRDVLDHLFHYAWRHGATAVSGQLDPLFMEALSDTYCVFHRDASWVLLQSRHPEVMAAILRGDAFLTRLEGEWWIGFQQ